DEGAFAALLARHGPMVLGVCRRVLRHTQDAEDAFQATFLVLARKAGAIGRREALGGWLYGVACRVAARARALLLRHRPTAHRPTADVPEPVGAGAAVDGASGGEVRLALQEEVARLPAKYRGPVVLCYLEGRTHEEAALDLGWPVGTVKGRLARARELLRRRL